MTAPVTPNNLHRGAKYFMDSGRASSAQEAVAFLRRLGLAIVVGPEVATSRDHQVALLTLVNCARRTLLGGVHVINAPRAALLAPLANARTLDAAIIELGGQLAENHNSEWPTAIIGTSGSDALPSLTSRAGEGAESPPPSWQLTWDPWRGGVIPVRDARRLPERPSGGLSPAFAAAACAAEAFLFHASLHPLAGRRTAGLSLWRPSANWLDEDSHAPAIQFLPASLWLVGLGNLGQASLWLLACLEYPTPQADSAAEPNSTRALSLMLQDDDSLAESNDSTSLLSSLSTVGQMKTRVLAAWLEARGFRTFIEERRFGKLTRRTPDEPAVALFGVDNALARQSIELAGFDLVVETGLGAGPNACQNFSLHTFPSSFEAAKLWSPSNADTQDVAKEALEAPAYDRARNRHLDDCGLTQLASRSIGIPYVGLAASTLSIAEILRRLHGGLGVELAAGCMRTLDDIETIAAAPAIYTGGHIHAASGESCATQTERQRAHIEKGEPQAA